MEIKDYDYLDGIPNPNIVTVTWDKGMNLKISTIRNLTPKIFSINHYGKLHSQFELVKGDAWSLSPRVIIGTFVVLEYMGLPEDLKRELKVLHEMFPSGKISVGKGVEFE